MDVVSLSQHYAQIAHALRPFMPSNCCSLNPEDVKLVGARPMAAGGFADIWKAIYDGRRVALKSYRCYMSFDVTRTVERFHNEVRACSLLRHRNVKVVPFVGVYSTETHPFALVYEHMDGLDLKQYLGNEPSAGKLKLLTDIAQSLDRIHNLGIVHGRLEATNILINKDGTPRIAGLGNVYILPHSMVWTAESVVDTDRRARRRADGAGPGLSPNVIDSTQDPKASDMYAFGILASEILTGHPPFFELTDVAATYAMFTGHRPPRPNHRDISDRLWEMVERCWHIVPSQRMSAGEAVIRLEAELRCTSDS